MQEEDRDATSTRELARTGRLHLPAHAAVCDGLRQHASATTSNRVGANDGATISTTTPDRSADNCGYRRTDRSADDTP